MQALKYFQKKLNNMIKGSCYKAYVNKKVNSKL